MCEKPEVETVEHFIMSCGAYQQERCGGELLSVLSDREKAIFACLSQTQISHVTSSVQIKEMDVFSDRW